LANKKGEKTNLLELQEIQVQPKKIIQAITSLEPSQ